ncbi:hypothetical protein chiPu_0025680, partial [Chiloscyllium punctatum]|nr:hypothetical protein [Chiloscyllium punctatum]
GTGSDDTKDPGAGNRVESPSRAVDVTSGGPPTPSDGSGSDWPALTVAHEGQGTAIGRERTPIRENGSRLAGTGRARGRERASPIGREKSEVLIGRDPAERHNVIERWGK